jgi:hypothetical protein
MIWVTLAILCTGLFAGAAIYINLVEHPARLECGTVAAIRQFAPSYRRASVMQASLAMVGAASAVAAWVLGAPLAFLGAGAVLGMVVPFTLLVIFPTNARLLDPRLDAASKEAEDLLARWNRLHAVRSALGLVAFALQVLASQGG